MILYLEKRRFTWPYRILRAFIAFSFMFSLILPPGYAQLLPASPAGGPQTILNLPAPGTMVTPTAAFTPTLIKGLTIHPENPLEFDFIVEKGQTPLQGEEFNKESMRLVKYFLASLTVPEEQMWVNLSPREEDRIISEHLGATEMGKDMLAQDYILKQLTASLMYPEEELGKKFWNRIYERAREQYGTAEIPLDTFNKVWIMPDKATVYEHEGSVFVIGSHLRVMLEEDYLATQHESSVISLQSSVSSTIIKEIILPEIEKEVNGGETFANLRQIYNSMILATWYKKNLRESLLGQVYVDKSKIKGVDLKDPGVNQKIYEQYLEAFKKGVYNYIKEDVDPVTKEIVPRKYFSGGAVGLKESNLTTLYSLPQKQQAEIVKAFREIGNSRDSRFRSLKIKLYEIAQANRISEEVMTEIVQGIENTTADEAQELFVGHTSSSPVSVSEWIKKTLAGEENIEVPAALAAAEKQKREYVIGGNWKMAVETEEKAVELIRAIVQKLNYAVTAKGLDPEDLDIVIAVAPSFVHLPAVRRELKRMEDAGEISTGLIALGAQDVSVYDPGARTSEISAKQLADLGIRYVIIGHSERRRGDVRETSRIVNAKVKKALEQGLIPIIAVGETLEEREAGRTFDVLMTQFLESTVDLTTGMTNVIIAYEPVWAIGTGRTATPQEADKAQRFLRAVVLNRYGQATAGAMRIQYGGSMNAANVESLIQKYNIDGGLIGGASLKPDDFVRIVTASLDHFNASSPVVEKLLREYWEAGENQPLLLQEIVEKTGLDKRFVLSTLETINNNSDMPFRVEPAGLHKKLGEETIWIRLVTRRPLGELRPRSSQRGGARGSSPVERIEEINSLLERIDKEIERPESGNLPEIMVTSDYHGEIKLFLAYIADAISRKIGRTVTLDAKQFPQKTIESRLKEQGVDIKEVGITFYILGDFLDRGAYGIKTFKAAEELVNLGIARYVTGNHDFWAFLNLMGFHLPVYEGYNFYGHTQSEELVRQHWNDADIAGDRIGWWTQRLAEYNSAQKKLQEEIFSGRLKEIREDFKKTYVGLKDQLTQEEKELWEDLIGFYFGTTDVYTGFNGVGLMSAQWWEEKSSKVKVYAQAARDTEGTYEINVAQAMKRQTLEKFEKYTAEATRLVRERLAQALGEGQWWWQVFNDINHQNYTSVEWWGKDWSSHEGWGTTVIDELNELEGEKIWNQANYIRNPYLQELAAFYRKHFTLYLKDPYGNTYTHGWLPVDKETGKISFTYGGITYEGNWIWDGLEAIQDDVRDLGKPLSELYEALNLVNSWYADKTTQIKPEHIAYNIKHLGLKKIYDANGIGKIWFTGHNPQNKLAPLGGGFKVQQGDYVLITTDKGMSWKKFGDLGGYVSVNARGIHQRGYSTPDFREIMDNPPVMSVKKGKGEGAGYEIIKPWANEPLSGENFLNIAGKQLKEELTRLQPSSSPIGYDTISAVTALGIWLDSVDRILSDEKDRPYDRGVVASLMGSETLPDLRKFQEEAGGSRWDRSEEAAALRRKHWYGLDAVYNILSRAVSTMSAFAERYPEAVNDIEKWLQDKKTEIPYPVIGGIEGIVRYHRIISAEPNLLEAQKLFNEGRPDDARKKIEDASFEIAQKTLSFLTIDIDEDEGTTFTLARSDKVGFELKTEERSHYSGVEGGSFYRDYTLSIPSDANGMKILQYILKQDFWSGNGESFVFEGNNSKRRIELRLKRLQELEENPKGFFEKWLASSPVEELRIAGEGMELVLHRPSLHEYPSHEDKIEWLEKQAKMVADKIIEAQSKKEKLFIEQLRKLKNRLVALLAEMKERVNEIEHIWSSRNEAENRFRRTYKEYEVWEGRTRLSYVSEWERKEIFRLYEEARAAGESSDELTTELKKLKNEFYTWWKKEEDSLFRSSSPVINREQGTGTRGQEEVLRDTNDEIRTTKEVGGIDLNPALLDLQIKRDGNGIPLPLPQQLIENMHIEGFLPIIINVTPVTNLPFLLGLTDTDTEQDADETIPTMKAREPEEISVLN